MKVLFVYPGYIVREVPLNLLYVSACARARGHECRLFHFSEFRVPEWFRSTGDRIAERFGTILDEYRPDVVGFSVMVQDYQVTKRLTSLAKKRGATVIWGGIEAILEPLRCLSEPDVDFVCTGEGEAVFPEFLAFLQNGRTGSPPRGIWYRDEAGKPIDNGRPDLIADLDALPFPDRELLPARYYRAELTGANVMTARGCPFPCTFCQNQRLMDIFRGHGSFVRYRSLESVLQEMEWLVKTYDSPCFYMSDEIFTLNRARVLEFCRVYPSRIGRPFLVQTRVDRMDEELAEAVSRAGCVLVNLAIESGNDEIRCQVLGKGTSREQIEKAFRVVHEHGMMSSSFNMIGVPGETLASIWDTIEVNRKLKPDRILCSIFMPLPGTELGESCRAKGMTRGNVYETTNYYSQVTVDLPGIRPRTLIGYQGFFDWFVLLPRWLHPAVHALRILYQLAVPPDLPRHTPLRKAREIVVEFVYQSKRFLPGKRLKVKTR
ncbi:MAG: hypothetical protein A3K19_12975 [Lentisphaerae bacterium RIFOXYB12_FULL_65_16]|nr:MAG: hypothetical protein A3K18_04730 [Lentisphaerae bacterium RIFOXYA12_64_32]OGV87224.1 MAG: hypothetical protein A3K19_12975 [Lentisphaerae bacterium RIFOXYB12_FULL_65_16]